MRVLWGSAVTLLLVGCRPEAGPTLGASSCSVGRPGSLVVAPAGLRAVSERCHTARTFAVWTDEAAMTSFAFGNETHTKAMAYFTRVATGGRTAHFSMPGSALPPSWDDVAARVARSPEVIR